MTRASAFYQVTSADPVPAEETVDFQVSATGAGCDRVRWSHSRPVPDTLVKNETPLVDSYARVRWTRSTSAPGAIESLSALIRRTHLCTGRCVPRENFASPVSVVGAPRRGLPTVLDQLSDRRDGRSTRNSYYVT